MQRQRRRRRRRRRRRARRGNFFRNQDRVDAVDFGKKSLKSEPSPRFLSRLKFENFARHFLVNSADRPRIGANLIMIRPNPGTIGRIHQKVASAFFVIGPQEMSCSQHKECPASNTRNVLLRTQAMSFLEHKECPSSNIRNVFLRTQGMSFFEHKEFHSSNTRNVLLRT